MKTRNVLTLVACLLLALALVPANAEGITLTDMVGATIELDAPATRVIGLTPADCEILYAIGAGDTLVGRGDYCDYPAEIFDIPSVGSTYGLNIEAVIALDPDVVLTTTMYDPAVIDALAEAGVKIVQFETSDIESVYTAIELIGVVVDHNDEAAALIASMRDSFAAIAAQAVDTEATVYFEVSPLEWGLWTAGQDTFMDEIANLLGLKNCFADVNGWAAISEEQVLERNPDYIVTITMYYGEGPTPVEELLGRAGWENVTAIQNAAILNLQNDELSRPSPRLVEGAEALLAFITK